MDKNAFMRACRDGGRAIEQALRALDRLRRPEREVPLEVSGAMSAETEQRIAELSRQQVPTPADDVRSGQLAECFQRCWEQFERDCPSHAAVIAWIVEDGLSNEEISELLDRTPGATREFISQCRKRARVYFAEWYTLAFGVSQQELRHE